MARRHWLMKTEPGTYSIQDLKKDGSTWWDGVRNYQARNFLRDEMKKGDLVLFYHSNAKPPGVAGIARISREGYPDKTQFDARSKYHDAGSSQENPRWFLVDVEFVEAFPEVVSLEEIKASPALEGMLVARRGMRLSVQPVEKEHFDAVRRMGRGK